MDVVIIKIITIGTILLMIFEYTHYYASRDNITSMIVIGMKIYILNYVDGQYNCLIDL